MKITQAVLDGIKNHAKAVFPIEACGYLGAKDGVVEKIYEMKNIDNSEEHFSFDPEEQIKVYLDSKAQGLKLSAVYHSHPYTPARPSEEDIKLAYDASLIYIIASLQEQEIDVKAFRIQNGVVTPEPIEEV